VEILRRRLHRGEACLQLFVDRGDATPDARARGRIRHQGGGAFVATRHIRDEHQEGGQVFAVLEVSRDLVQSRDDT
jgi:hypothetical protein